MIVFKAFFYICLGDPNEQILQTKIKSHICEKVPDKEAPFYVSPTAPVWRAMPISRTFLPLSLGELGVGAL
jgi:hypothetical protein